MEVIIDGDIVAFISAAQEPDNVDAAIERANALMEDIRECTFSDTMALYIKGDGNFRYDYSDYKANRTGTRPGTLEDVRDHLANHEFGYRAHGAEADDYVVAHAHRLRQEGKPYIIATIDKDLRQMPGLHYNIRSQQIDEVTEEMADMFYYQQCITGDSADGIAGIRGIGPKKSSKLLEQDKPLPQIVAEAWQAAHPEDWEERLEKCWNLVYMRRSVWDCKVLPLPEEFRL